MCLNYILQFTHFKVFLALRTFAVTWTFSGAVDGSWSVDKGCAACITTYDGEILFHLSTDSLLQLLNTCHSGNTQSMSCCQGCSSHAWWGWLIIISAFGVCTGAVAWVLFIYLLLCNTVQSAAHRQCKNGIYSKWLSRGQHGSWNHGMCWNWLTRSSAGPDLSHSCCSSWCWNSKGINTPTPI